MSRSNPQENSSPNPSTRWFEWNGEHGLVRYYDKDAKKNVDVGSDFTFLLLDQLASVRGWHKPSDSGIYSNEVKDTLKQPLIVKAFKAPGPLAEGLYREIKDRVNAVGGQFVANCYVAFKNGGGELSIGSLRLKGAALGQWMEFGKANRSDLYKKAIRIHGFTEGKTGRITFRMPVFKVVDVTEQTDQAATALDVQFQEWLNGYLKRTTRDQVERSAPTAHEEYADEQPYDDEPPYESSPQALTDDDIPF